jgi:hypothetical protein
MNPRGATGYGLTKFCSQQELGREREDSCYINQRDRDSAKPFEFVTYHHHPYGSRVQATCYPGQHYWDGYGIGGSNVDEESAVSRHPGHEMTKDKDRHQLPMFPVQMPQVKGWFDADTSSGLRSELDPRKCSKGGVTQTSFIPLSFQIFDSLCYDPQESRFIIPEDTFNCNFSNAKFYHNGGEDTRHERMEKYRNACDWKPKNAPPNLSYSNWGY